MSRTRESPVGAHKSAKRNKNRPQGGSDDDSVRTVRKPGLESSLAHIAQMFIGKDNDLATELTFRLNSRACRCVGVFRRDR